MENQIYFVTSEYDLPKEGEGDFIITLDGMEIDTFEKFLCYIEKEFHFPESCQGMFNRFMDWICDLTWLDYKSYIVIIKSYSNFMSKSDYNLKCLVMNAFQHDILPFWEEDVSKIVVGGTPHSFKIYLLEEDKGTVLLS